MARLRYDARMNGFGKRLTEEGDVMWNRIKPKKMYLSIFLYSGIAVSLLMIVFTVILSQRFAKTALDEMDETNQEKLNQMVNASEFTLQKLRQFALKIYSDETISQWLHMDKNEYSPLTLNKAAISVREFMSSEPFIHTIYLINFNIDQIYTSDSSIYTTRDFYDQDMLKVIRSQKTPYLQYFNHLAGDESFLALVVPAAAPHQNFHGYAAILFSKPLLNLNMLQILEDDKNKVYIQGNQNEFILGNTDSALTKAVAGIKSSSSAQSWRWESADEAWLVRTKALPIEGWTIYHLSPISLWETKVAKIRYEIIFSSLVLLFAMLLFLFWQSYRSLKPISDLVAQIQTKLGKRHPVAGPGKDRHEMEWIHSGFHSLVERIEQLDSSIKSSQALVKDDFLRQWILNPKSSKPIEEFISTKTQILQTGAFRMAVIRLESYGRFEEQYDFASRKLMRFAMGNIMAEVLSNRGYPAEAVDFGSDHIVALAAVAAAGEAAPFAEAMEEVRVQISRWIKLEVQAAVSTILDVEENLSIIYSQLYELTLLSFIHHENRIFTADDPERLERGNDSDPDEALLKQVIQSVQLKNDKALEGYLDQLTLHMQDLSYEECKLQLTHIIYFIMKSFKNDKPFQGMKGIHSFLEQFANLDEVKMWLYRELMQIMEKNRRKNNTGRKDEVAVEMVEYVRNHFHNPMLAVDDVAAHISMSVNYARQIFKEHFQCSLSDYITNQRIEHAIKLLTTTDWTVAEITEQSGFQTKSTFFSTFKRATGMTPNHYRLEHARTDK